MHDNRIMILRSILQTHDWSYDFSEDQQKWYDGNMRERQILSLVNDLGDKGKEIYNKFAPSTCKLKLERISYVKEN